MERKVKRTMAFISTKNDGDKILIADAIEWADKTMIEKVRQWFNLHFRQVGTPKEIRHDFESKEKMWKSFTQFMEE